MAKPIQYCKVKKKKKKKALIYVATPGLNEKGFGQSESVGGGGRAQ